MKKRIISIVLATAMILSLSTTFAFASLYYDKNHDYIRFIEPTELDNVAYKGEDFYVKVYCEDRWADQGLNTTPAIVVKDTKSKKITICYAHPTPVRQNSYRTYDISLLLDTSIWKSGREYLVSVILTPVTGQSVESLMKGSKYAMPADIFKIKVKSFGKPANVRLSAGEGSVTASWKSVEGAYHYQVYRSTSKKKGYKKIGTTYTPEFTDNAVKKGRSYYYKIRAVRTFNKTVYGAFTSPKKSGKVR